MGGWPIVRTSCIDTSIKNGRPAPACTNGDRSVSNIRNEIFALSTATENNNRKKHPLPTILPMMTRQLFINVCFY